MSEQPLDRRDDEDETTDGRSQIIIHESGTPELHPSIGDQDLIDLVAAHFSRYAGDAEFVLHEAVSNLVHIDVHQIPPTEDFPCNILFTTGMSERPMHVPEAYEGPRFAEVFALLPEDWKLPGAYEVRGDEENEAAYWPIHWLKILARLPHQFETWLGPGHTVPNGDPPEPFAPDTKLCCMMAIPPLIFDEDFPFIKRGDDEAETIGLLMLMPLYKEEMEFKLRKGADELMGRFEKFELDVVDLFQPDRPNVCTKKRWF